jgi:hypothetical protein
MYLIGACILTVLNVLNLTFLLVVVGRNKSHHEHYQKQNSSGTNELESYPELPFIGLAFWLGPFILAKW